MDYLGNIRTLTTGGELCYMHLVCVGEGGKEGVTLTTEGAVLYRMRLMFGGDFDLALWRCGSRTANNNVHQ